MRVVNVAAWVCPSETGGRHLPQPTAAPPTRIDETERHPESGETDVERESAAEPGHGGHTGRRQRHARQHHQQAVQLVEQQAAWRGSGKTGQT